MPLTRSPYSYNIPYRRAGADPSKVPTKHLGAAKFVEEQFVVSLKPATHFIDGNSAAWIEYSDDCTSSLKKAELELRVAPMSSKREPDIEIIDVTPSHESEIFTSSEIASMIKDGKIVLASPGHSEHYDLVCLGEDGQYIEVESSLDSEGRIAISAPSSGLSSLKTIYAVDLDNSDQMSKEFEVNDVQVSALDIDYASEAIEVPNSSSSFDTFLAVNSLDGTRLVVHPNVNSKSFVLPFSEVGTVRSLIAQATELQSQIEVIARANPGTPSAMLYALDPVFKACIDKKEKIEAKVSLMQSSGQEIDISSVFAYKSLCSKTFVIQEGVSKEGVEWSGRKAKITHGLGGAVKIMVDDSYSSEIKFNAKHIDSNTVEIEFIDDVLSVYSVTMYKI